MRRSRPTRGAVEWAHTRSVVALLLVGLAACSRAEGGGRPRQSEEVAARGLAVVPSASVVGALPVAIERAREGCAGMTLLAAPEDRAARGPWPVGLKTVHVGALVADVYYPAELGSGDGVPRAYFDLREHLPTELAQGAAARALPQIACQCARELPLDRQRGPYPLVVFLHGRGLSRMQFPTLLAHLASRGFVVLAPDVPGVTLADVLSGVPQKPVAAAFEPMWEELAKGRGELRFLAGSVGQRVGLVGHSQGASVVNALLPRMGDVAVVMAAGGVRAVARPVMALVVAGEADGFVPMAVQRQGFASTPAPRRFLAVSGAGHLAFADFCAIGAEYGGIYGEALARGVDLWGFPRVLGLRGCSDARWASARTMPVIVAAVTAQLEETLMCDSEAPFVFARLRKDAAVAEWAEVKEALVDVVPLGKAAGRGGG